MGINDNKQRLVGDAGNSSANARNNVGLTVFPSTNIVQSLGNGIQKIGDAYSQGAGAIGQAVGSHMYDADKANGGISPIDGAKGFGRSLGSLLAGSNRPPSTTTSPSFTNNPASSPVSAPSASANPNKPALTRTAPQDANMPAEATFTQPMLSNSGIGTTTFTGQDIATRNKNMGVLANTTPELSSNNAMPQQRSLGYAPDNGNPDNNIQQSASEAGGTRDLLEREMNKHFKNTGLINALLGHIDNVNAVNQKYAGLGSDQAIAAGRNATESNLGMAKIDADTQANYNDNERAREIGQQTSAAAQARLGLDASQHSDKMSQEVMKNLLARKDAGADARTRWTGLVQDLNGKAPSLDHLKNVFSEDNYNSMMAKDEPGFVQHLRSAGISDDYGVGFLAERRAQQNK